MLASAARRLLTVGGNAGSTAAAAVMRPLSTSSLRLDEFAPPAGPKEFGQAWTKQAPSNLDVPQLPSMFLTSQSTGESQVQGDLFPVNFYTPHGVLADNVKKDGVVLPGVDGVFGVKASHVPTIAQLKPGMVELHSGADVEKWFISGGFAFVHPNGVADICVLEAAPLDQIDGPAVKAALSAAQSASGGDDYDAAVQRTTVELYAALDSAVDSKA